MNRDYYKVSYTCGRRMRTIDDVLDNDVDTEFNANQFKLFDDFTTDLRINYNSSSFRRRGDPNDSGVDMENGNPMDDNKDTELLENEVMVDPWSSMDSSNSPLTDSVPSASDDCSPSTSSEPPRGSQDPSPLSPEARRTLDSDPKLTQPLPPKTDKARSRDLTLPLDPEPLPRRPHFLDDDYQNPSRSNIECRIPKPHFLDHSPSPDEFDERSDITNPNFLDDDADDDLQKKAGALPKKNVRTPTYLPQEERPHRTSYRSTLHYGLENAARSSERDKRASQLYRDTWPGERDIWTCHDTASVRSFSSNGSADGHRPSSNLDNKMDCVISLISLLSLSPENNADLSGPLLEMSRSVESCVAMRQAGCIPLLVQLIHSKVSRETRDRAAKALRNIIHTQTDDKAGRREARVWRLLEQVREYCYILEDVVENRKEGKEVIEEDNSKHPSQSVAALMKLSFDEEHRHVVCQLGGLQALAALVSGDQAAHGSRTDDSTCLTMRKYAGMTLTNLTFGDGNNKSLLCSFKEFMLALVEQLESPNDDMRQVTAAVLRNLSWRADTSSKQVLREVGAVKGLTKAAMTCQKEATLKSVLSALWNLTAHCSMNKVALCSVDGALGFLVDMLSYDSPTKTLAIVENAGGIMRNVSSHIAVREDYRQILRERNCLSVLLQHLKSPSLTVVSNSCGTLWNLSARCPQDQQFLWDHGAVPMLRSLIHSKHKMIAMGSGAALKNLLNSKPGKTHIISLDTTARTMNLPALPTLGARKQKALEQELDQNLAETCDNIEPATSPTTSNRDEKNLFTATERQIAMNLNRMSTSSPLMGALTSQISLSHSAHLASYLSCSNTLLKGALTTRSNSGSSHNVNRSDSKDSVTSAQSDTVFERVMRTGKVPVPTPRNKDLMRSETGGEAFKMSSKPLTKDGYPRYPTQPPIPPPRTTDMRTNYTESGYDVDQDSCDQPIDFSRKYSETKSNEPEPSLVEGKPKPTKKYKKDGQSTFGDYQETDLDQPTDYSLRYAEHQSENGSDISEPPGPSVHEDTIKHFATEGTPYETPIIFSTATSMSDLRVIGKDGKPKSTPSVKENPEVMTHSDEKDTCSIEDPPRHDNDRAIVTPQNPEPVPEKRSAFDTKFSSGMISPEKPVNYCDEGTPGYFSRVSSLSSLGEPTEEDNLAKKNAMATINVEPAVQDQSASSSKDKEGLKAVTFATEPLAASSQPSTPGRFVEDTPLMFSRSSSLGSLPEAEDVPDQGSVLSEVSRLTSGCMSPSEIPDSPGAPASPRAHSPSHTPPTVPELDACESRREVSVFDERTSQFLVENTPAQCSPPDLSSLSSLTIEEDIKPSQLSLKPSTGEESSKNDPRERSQAPRPLPARTVLSEPLRGTVTPGDSTQIYYTEDTPAILSKAGSNSNLSALSIDSPPARAAHDTSDSNLSDAGDLLEECIQKGIAKAVKNNQSSDLSPVNYSDRDNVYKSLPPQLRAPPPPSPPHPPRAAAAQAPLSPESGAQAERSPPAPPLPPKDERAPAPPRPPRRPAAQPARQGRRHESRLPVKTQRNSGETPRLPLNLPHDSSSSLSLDSFGSTDREIFEETVQAGATHGRAKLDKAHSVERPTDHPRHTRNHKSLDRSDKISQHRPKLKETDPDFERNIASGAYNINPNSKIKRLDREFAGHSLTRSPYSYHGESLSMSQRFRGHSSRFYDDGPPSLPARIDEPRRQLERSNSLSSLSNDSFGSTDKEVFERCVRMGMSKAQPKKNEKLRVRSDDRSERDHRRRRKDARSQGALDRMVGEDSRDRALLEEVIARGAGEGKSSKNVRAPPPPAPRVGGAPVAPPPPHPHPPGSDRAGDLLAASYPSLDTSASRDPPPSNLATSLTRSNECLAPRSANTTIDSEVRDELNRSNESYADVLDGSWSDEPRNCEATTLTKLQYTDIKYSHDRPCDESRHDTWNDNTCPDDVTFPTMSGSVHMLSSIRSELADPAPALPDLLEKSEPAMSNRPDLTDKLDDDTVASELQITDNHTDGLLDNIPEPSYASLVDDGEHKFDSLMAAAIEKEAARLAAQLKNSTYGMENSVTSLTSLDLDNVRPPSHLGSLLSLSASGQWEDTSKKSQKSRKKSLPVTCLVKRALSNSMHQGSSEHLDSNPVSFLDSVKPPSEMDHLDMESSMVSVSSIVSEVADRERTPVVFDFKQPIQDFPLCHNFNLLDLDKVNPPSLFDEMAESTVEIEPTTAHQLHDEISSTLNVVTDIPSGSENCTPLPSDVSSVESTPKKQRDAKYLTPKEKRSAAKDRYQTYTIIDPPSESDVLTVTSDFVTWTKSESDRSDDYVTANSDAKSKRKMSAKQRRLEDRARYQTQTVNIQSIIQETKTVDPQIESLKQRLASKKTMKQKRAEDAERFRTRTLSEDIPPSPTFVTKDANFENVETTTGYDSLSSNELNHQQIIDDRQDDVFRETDSGHTEDDFELNSTQMQTYTKSFRNYLPVIESPTAVDICVVNNLKNIEMTASYRRALQSAKVQNPSSSDFASYEGDSRSDKSDSDDDAAPRPKPKITKPERRDESLDSNDSHETEEPKAVRGRKKAAYVSPYRRSVPPAKKPTSTIAKAPVKPLVKAIVPPKPSAKPSTRTPSTSKPPSANTSPKKTLNKSPSKIAQKAVAIPLVAGKALPLERQGTFTKEESSVAPKDLPASVTDKKPTVSRYAKATPKPAANNTSPSRLPQLNRYTKPPLKKGGSSEKPAPKPKSAMRNSASNHSLQSNDSAKTVTLASRGSRQGSSSSVNSVQSSKINAKDVESKIASLWKKVEQTKKVISKPDRRVWIEGDKTETPKLIRSSTFEGQPKQSQVSSAPKQKTAIGIKVSQIPSLRPKSTPSKITAPAVKKPVISRVFTRKPANGQAT